MRLCPVVGGEKSRLIHPFRSRKQTPISRGRAPTAGSDRERAMDFDKYTERARGFIQSAQSLALREGHQQFSTEHLLKVLLDDSEGLASGDPRRALAAVEAALKKRPRVEGGGAGQIYLDPALARVFDTAEKAGK